MGFYKDKMIEEEGRDYYLPDNNKYLCANHYDDIYLKKYIEEHSSPGVCSYCGRKTIVINLTEFVEYLMQKILKHFNSPDEDGLFLSNSLYDDENETIPGLKRVGDYVTRESAKTYDSTKELLLDIGLVSDSEDLYQDIENCIIDKKWIQKDSMICTVEEELSILWNDFAKMVTNQRRYTFYKLKQFNDAYFSKENGLQDILSELSCVMDSLNLYKKLSVNTKLYRCRYVKREEDANSFDDLTSPPDDKASENRMNPAGISMFYGSFDSNTVKKEARDSGNKYCVIGEFVTIKDLVILDLTNLPSLSFWNDNWQELKFIYSFSKEVSKPIDTEYKLCEYVPTQIFSEYVRYCCYNKGTRIDGIKFKSSICEGQNIVLFYNQKDSKNILKLTTIKLERNQ